MTEVAKFPRIPHLPWSPGDAREDKKLDDVSGFLGVEVVVTEKMDGSNVCLTPNTVFARSHSGPPVHPSFDWLKAWHASMKGAIPEYLSVFCEYTYAVHSIEYEAVPSYLWVIAVRDERRGYWLDWHSTRWMADTKLGLPTVPVIGYGPFQREDELHGYTNFVAAQPGFFGAREGVVIRRMAVILENGFNYQVAKWVREGHVTSEEHWMNQPIRKQKLLGGERDAKTQTGAEVAQGTNLG